MSASVLADEVLGRLRLVLGREQGQVALHEPCFGGNEWRYLKECLDSGWVSSVGSFVDRFEQDLARYTGARRAVAVVNGTAALHVCLKLAGVEEGDEVLIPALTFVATANAVSYCGADVHLVECEERTMGVDPAKLERHLSEVAELNSSGCYNRRSGRRIAALVVMHTFGHPVDLDPICELCRSYRLELVEDAAESLGSYYKGVHTGNRGRLAALSFNGNKTVTTGGGGAILTNDEELAAAAKHLTTTARVPHRWAFSHDRIGFNYRMPNLNAALGCAQLEQLDEMLALKRRLAQRYREAFSDLAGVSFLPEPPFARSNYWLNALLLDEAHAGERDGILELCNGAGLMIRPAWTLMHRLPMFSGAQQMELSVAESLERRLLNIPSSARLGAGA